jgi:hypothetical protein
MAAIDAFVALPDHLRVRTVSKRGLVSLQFALRARGRTC